MQQYLTNLMMDLEREPLLKLLGGADILHCLALSPFPC